MTTTTILDGLLVQWGDRLFYPGNRMQPTLLADVAKVRGDGSHAAPAAGDLDHRSKTTAASCTKARKAFMT